MAEHLASIIVLNGFKLKKSTLLGCKMKYKLDVFNRVEIWVKMWMILICGPFSMRIEKYPFLILNFWFQIQLFMNL